MAGNDKGTNAPRANRTCESLRLDIESAMKGQTWLLLPEGFRDQESGKSYPLPSARTELQRLIVIPLPPTKQDSGCIYLRRAMTEFRSRMAVKNSAINDINKTEQILHRAREVARTEMNKTREEMRLATEQVRAEAAKAVANLSDLFELGRRGIDEQMRAYLDGREFQGERIDADGFRQCFRLVSQAVKGLGLPSEQRQDANKAIMDQLAESLDATKKAIDMYAGDDEGETQH